MKYRVVQYVVQPVVVADDGTDLTPVHVDPITVTAAAMAEWPAAFLADLQAAEGEQE